MPRKSTHVRSPWKTVENLKLFSDVLRRDWRHHFIAILHYRLRNEEVLSFISSCPSINFVGDGFTEFYISINLLLVHWRFWCKNARNSNPLWWCASTIVFLCPICLRLIQPSILSILIHISAFPHHDRTIWSSSFVFCRQMFFLPLSTWNDALRFRRRPQLSIIANWFILPLANHSEWTRMSVRHIILQ